MDQTGIRKADVGKFTIMKKYSILTLVTTIKCLVVLYMEKIYLSV